MTENRYQIALLAATITDPFSNALAKGAMRAAERLGADLTIFPGKYIGIQDKYDLYDTTYEYQYNFLFNIAAQARFDYIIAATGTIAYALDNNKKKEFLDSLGDTPVLSVAAEIEGYDSLCFDNTSAVYDIVRELTGQGRKAIGMMVGDLNNSECMERFAAFRRALEKYGAPFDPRYIMQSDISEYCENEAGMLLDRAPELDAIVCVNDKIALVVCQELKKLGLTVGPDVAVTGFDDLPAAREMVPPLATVSADAELLGQRAVEKAVNRLRGIPDEESRVPASFIRRGSCMREEYAPAPVERLSENERQKLREASDQRVHIDNIFIRDAMMFSADIPHSYAKSMKQLSLIGAMTGFVYTLEKPLIHRFDSEPPAELSWLFRSYSYGQSTFAVPAEEQKMTTPEVFRNSYLCCERQHCFIVADLYVAESQYGIALLEPRDPEFFSELELITYILSSSVRVLDMMSRQEKLLGRLRTANLALEQESKIDTLTGLYNRRGFYSAADKLFEDGAGSEYVVCYADLDDLKGINDRYGHTEGDFALRLAAECLRQVFGSSAVIGRLGGDEFSAVLPFDGTDTDEYQARKQHFEDSFNGTHERPYKFGVSMGILRSRGADGYELRASLDIADGLLYKEKQKRKKGD